MPQPGTSDQRHGDRPAEPDLRQRRRTRTKALIQSETLALIAEKGYHQTSIEDIAHAAAISPRTFYRYYATKEDVVLWDEYDELPLEEVWEAHPGDDPSTLMARRLREMTAQLYLRNPAQLLTRIKLAYTVPEIRARFINQTLDLVGPHYAQLADTLGVPRDDLQLAVTVTASLSAMLIAVDRWQRHDGAEDLLSLLDEAIMALSNVITSR